MVLVCVLDPFRLTLFCVGTGLGQVLVWLLPNFGLSQAYTFIPGSWHSDGNLNSGATGRNKQPSQNQTVTPSSSSRSTAALSHHFITLCAEWASFMSVGFMTLRSQARGPDTNLHQRLSQIPLLPLVCCGQTTQMWADWSALKGRL